MVEPCHFLVSMDMKSSSLTQSKRQIWIGGGMSPAKSKQRLTNQEVAKILEDFLEGKGDDWVWDDFTLGTSFGDHRLETIRIRCAGLSQEYPPKNPGEYTNDEGQQVIRNYIKELRSGN